MIPKNENFDFLLKKIQEIKIARFKAEINSELRLPPNIISTLKTESDGTIWFFTSCNGYHAKKIDKRFFASLEYYQKGRDYSLKFSGTATIVEDNIQPYTTAIKENNYLPETFVLIQFKIKQAEYYERKQQVNTSLKAKVRYIFGDFFFPQTHRIFDFSKSA